MTDKEQIKTNDRIFLLSAEEANKLPRLILNCNQWWWLRTAGFDNELVATVTDYGQAFRSSKHAYNNYGGVRPAIRFDRHEEILTLDITNGGYYKYLGKKWIDITDYIGFPCLLKKKPFKAPSRFDATINCYATSEIRKWLLDWYEAVSIKRLLLKWHKSVESKPEMTPIQMTEEAWKHKVIAELWVHAVKEEETKKEISCNTCKLNGTKKCLPVTCAMIGRDGHGLWEPAEREEEKNDTKRRN